MTFIDDLLKGGARSADELAQSTRLMESLGTELAPALRNGAPGYREAVENGTLNQWILKNLDGSDQLDEAATARILGHLGNAAFQNRFKQMTAHQQFDEAFDAAIDAGKRDIDVAELARQNGLDPDNALDQRFIKRKEAILERAAARETRAASGAERPITQSDLDARLDPISRQARRGNNVANLHMAGLGLTALTAGGIYTLGQIDRISGGEGTNATIDAGVWAVKVLCSNLKDMSREDISKAIYVACETKDILLVDTKTTAEQALYVRNAMSSEPNNSLEAGKKAAIDFQITRAHKILISTAIRAEIYNDLYPESEMSQEERNLILAEGLIDDLTEGANKTHGIVGEKITREEIKNTLEEELRNHPEIANRLQPSLKRGLAQIFPDLGLEVEPTATQDTPATSPRERFDAATRAAQERAEETVDAVTDAAQDAAESLSWTDRLYDATIGKIEKLFEPIIEMLEAIFDKLVGKLQPIAISAMMSVVSMFGIKNDFNASASGQSNGPDHGHYADVDANTAPGGTNNPGVDQDGNIDFESGDWIVQSGDENVPGGALDRAKPKDDEPHNDYT